jgi:hypothetical protein
MRFTTYIFFTALLLSFLPVAATFGSSSNTVQANVTVVCPFYLSANVLPVYSVGGSMPMNYTIYTQAVCTINNLHGSFAIEYSSNNVQVLSDTLPVTTATQTPTLYSLPPVNSFTLSAGSYKAIVDFSAYKISNESTRTFLMVNPTNIVITNFTESPSSLNIGDPVTFMANVLNDGQLASGPIGMNIVITGPQSITISEPIGALSPGQSEDLTYVFSNLTSMPGTYTASLSATFTSSNIIVQSSVMNSTYSVAQTQTTSHGAPPVPANAVITTMPRLEFTQLPFYSSLELGAISVTSLGLESIANVPIKVILSIPSEFSGIFGLGAYNITLVPSENLLVQLVFNANNLKLPGMYVVPMGISVSSQNGGFVNSTQFFTYVVSRSSYNASLYSQIQTEQDNATVTTTLVGARNMSLINATLVTMLPRSVVSNSSQIKTYGEPSTITTTSNGELRINWLVPYLPPGKGITLAYTISKPNNIGLLESVQNLLVVPSVATPSSVLRVVSIQTPTFYTNSTNKVSVGVLYTGTLQQNVKFVLTTTGTATVMNPVQFVNASPNQLLQQTFSIKTMNMTGTLLLNLGIETQNVSLNYTLPVLVLLKSGPTSTTSTIPQVSYMTTVIRYAPLILGIAAVCIVVFALRRMGKRPKYQPERAKELIRIREQIKRSDEHA